MSETKITDVTRPSLDEWEREVDSCEYATYFHSAEWARIWEEYSGGRIVPRPVLLSFGDGARVLLPFSVEKAGKGLIRTTLSSPAGTYGGWISSDVLGLDHLQSLQAYIRREYRNIVMRANPYSPDTLELPGFLLQDDVTHRVALDKPFEELEKKWRNSHRYEARKAKEAGVTVRESSSKDDWEAYADVYQDSLRRWGSRASSQYRPELFEIIRLLRSPRIKLWLAEYQGDVVAGALCLCSRRHMIYWHGAAREEFLSVHPVKYLLHEVLYAACEEGYAWFDFNPSGGHEGVVRFKQGYNPEASRCPVYIAQSSAKRLHTLLAP